MKNTIKYSFFSLLFSGSLLSQDLKTVKLDDGTVLDADTYSFFNEVDKNNKLMSPMACASAANLVTFYATNNAQRGHMMDLQAISSVNILCFDMNFSAGTSNVEIYTKAGTHVGFENTAGAWTLVGTAANVASAGVNVPTAIPIAVNVAIAAGNTQAFYITRTTLSGPTVAYTNGTATGNLLASNATLKLFEGTGKEYPFSTNFKPRQFNGAVYYNLIALPIELSEFTATHSGNSVNLNWTTATEKNNNYFTVERSNDSKNFESLSQIKGAGTSNSVKHYSFVDEKPLNGVSYYRIKQADFDGKETFSEMKAVSYQRNINFLQVNPMPAKDNLMVSFKAIEAGDFTLMVYSADGRLVVNKELHVENGSNDAPLSINELPAGIYQLVLVGEKDSERCKFVKE